jgi:hypothetical protein
MEGHAGRGAEVSETNDNIKNDIVAAVKSAFEDIVRDALAGAKGDLKAYGQQLTQEFGKYLWRAYQGGDEVARENLKDLKAQVLLIAVRREIIVERETMARLKEIVEIAARIALKALIAAAVAL